MTEPSLFDFLEARYDERKLVLLNVGPARLAWVTFRNPDGSMRYTSAASSNGDEWVCDGHVVEPDSVQVVFDRDEQLADLAAKRQILEMHDESEGEHELRHGHWEGHGSNERWIRDEPNDCPVCHYPGKPDAWFLAEDAPCRTVRLFALPWAAHPDYRPEWAPDASRP